MKVFDDIDRAALILLGYFLALAAIGCGSIVLIAIYAR